MCHILTRLHIPKISRKRKPLCSGERRKIRYVGTFKNGGVQSKNFDNNKSKTTKLSKGERINALRKILGDKVSPVDYLYPDEKRLEEKIKDYGLEDELRKLDSGILTGGASGIESSSWDKPTNYVRISSPYGWRIHPTKKTNIFHQGIDLAVPQGTSVKSPTKGIVEFAGTKGGYGYTVIINHGKINGKEIKTKYAHLSKIKVKNGQKIDAKTEIGLSGILENGATKNPLNHTWY